MQSPRSASLKPVVVMNSKWHLQFFVGVWNAPRYSSRYRTENACTFQHSRSTVTCSCSAYNEAGKKHRFFLLRRNIPMGLFRKFSDQVMNCDRPTWESSCVIPPTLWKVVLVRSVEKMSARSWVRNTHGTSSLLPSDWCQARNIGLQTYSARLQNCCFSI